MKKTFRRVLACLLTVLMVAFSLPSFTAFAGGEKYITNYQGYADLWPEIYGDYFFGDKIDVDSSIESPTGGYDPCIVENYQDSAAIAFIVTDIGHSKSDNYDSVENARYATYGYNGTKGTMSYAELEEEGRIVNPAKLKAGQRISIACEFAGIDVFYSGQVKGTYDTAYLKEMYYRSNTNWSATTTTTQCVPMKGENTYPGILEDGGSAAKNGDFLYSMCDSQDGNYNSIYFVGNQLTGDDAQIDNPLGTYGVNIATITFEVLQDCDLTEVFWPMQHYGYTFVDPYNLESLEAMDILPRQYDTQEDSPWGWPMQVIWDSYDAGTEDNHTHNFSGDVVSNNDGTHKIACADFETCQTYSGDTNCVYGDPQIVKAATATENGTARYTCQACGYYYDVETQLTGANAATCTAAGYSGDTVLVSDNDVVIATGSEVEALGHDFTGAVVSNENGTHKTKCARFDACGTYSDDADCSYGNAEVVKEATHTEQGVSRETCSVCGYNNDTAIPALTSDHAATKVVNAKAATCTEDGYTGDTVCTADNEVIATGTSIDALGHAFTGNVVSNEDGTHKTECARFADCGTYSENADCSYGDAVVVSEATVDANGSVSYTCDVCGYVKTEATTIVGNKAATCTAEGYTGDTVLVSDNNVVIATGSSIDALGHDFTGAVVSNEDGTHKTECARFADCGTYSENADCNYGEAVETPASCDKTGTSVKTCEDCGYESTTVLGKIDHTPVSANNAVDATIDAEGHEADTVCQVCGELLEKGATIDKLPSVVVTVKATDLGTVTLNDEDVTAGVEKNVAKNSTVTLTAEPVDGATFVGWALNGTKIVSDEATFTTTALANVTYVPVFTETTDETFTVVFADSFGNVISTQSDLTAGTDIVDSITAPNRVGYTFVGWSLSADEIDALTEGTTILAKYEKNEAKTFTVTAIGSEITVNGEVTNEAVEGIAYDTLVSVKRAGTDYWTIDGTVVAYGDTYTFYVGSDVTVVAEEDDTAVAVPTVGAVSVDEISGSTRVAFLATYSMEDGYSHVSHGFIYGKNVADENNLTLDNVDNSAIRVSYCKTASNQFSLNVGSSNATVTVRAFLVYEVDGELVPVYATPQSHTFA
jgi:rubredoxin